LEACARQHRLSHRAGSRGRKGFRNDVGAAAVEFALLLPLLMMFLFGIIQYGYGLFQLQQFSSTMGDASRLAATGITSCNAFKSTLGTIADDNGLDGGDVSSLRIQWLTANGDVTNVAQRLGLAKITASYRPFKIGIPFVPFPDTITRSQTVTIQDIGTAALPGLVC
jgi:Flp pilus assembly protein TadG